MNWLHSPEYIILQMGEPPLILIRTKIPHQELNLQLVVLLWETFIILSLELWAGLGIGGRVRIFVRITILKNILFWKKLLAWNERLNWNIATSKEFVSSLVFKLPTNYLTIILSETNHSLKNFNQLNHLKKKKGDTDFG